MRVRQFVLFPLLGVLVSISYATEVYVNDPIVAGIVPVGGSTVFGGTYRVSQGGADQTLGLTEATADLSR